MEVGYERALFLRIFFCVIVFNMRMFKAVFKIFFFTIKIYFRRFKSILVTNLILKYSKKNIGGCKKMLKHFVNHANFTLGIPNLKIL